MNPIDNPKDRFTCSEERAFAPGGNEALYNDFPFWGLMTFASACVLFAVNVNSWIIGLFFPIVIFLSMVIKVRFKISGTVELILTTFLSLLFVIIQGGPFFKTMVLSSLLNNISYFLNFFLLFIIVINIYRVKNASDYYMSFVSSVIFVVIASLFSPWNPSVKNIIAFIFYGFSTVLYFIDLTFMSYPVVQTEKPFRKYQALPFIIALLVVVIASLYVARYSKKFEPSILQFLIRNTDALPNYSFSSVTELGQNEYMFKSSKIVMRIIRKGGADYATARTYNIYNKGKWSIDSEKINISPVTQGIAQTALDALKDNSFPVFSILPSWKRADEKSGYSLESYIILLRKNTLIYYSGNSAYALINKPSLETDRLGNLTYSGDSFDEFQIVACEKTAFNKPEQEPFNEKDLIVPDNFLPEFSNIAREVTKDRKDAMAKAFAIQLYFQQNFQYKLGIKLTHPEMDPVKEFLVYRKAAHCEYYASAMVLMLRSIGIPARYKVGYIVHEYNQPGGYFIVRDKDAHAWVQAYIPDKGWVEFDPTPPSAVNREMTTYKNDWLDFLNMKMKLLMSYIKSGSFKKLFKELLSMGLALVKNTYVWIIFTAIILIIIAVKKGWIQLLFRSKVKSDDCSGFSEGENVLILRSLLAEFDELVKDIKIPRPLHLTFTEFLDYLREKEVREDIIELFRNFLAKYAYIRYSLTEVTENEINGTRMLLSEIKSTLLEGKKVF